MTPHSIVLIFIADMQRAAQIGASDRDFKKWLDSGIYLFNTCTLEQTRQQVWDRYLQDKEYLYLTRNI